METNKSIYDQHYTCFQIITLADVLNSQIEDLHKNPNDIAKMILEGKENEIEGVGINTIGKDAYVEKLHNISNLVDITKKLLAEIDETVSLAKKCIEDAEDERKKSYEIN
jgi:hypothetical protein